jgi:hypothetical protein
MAVVVLLFVIGVIVAALLACIPASIAAQKGLSFGGFLVFGFFFFVPALIVALVISAPATPRAGDIVATLRSVNVNAGAPVPRGWASKVIDTDVIHGVPTVMIVGPSGASHWVASRDVRFAR